MKYKELKKEFGVLDRKMLKLMLGIAPNKKEKGISRVTIQAFGEGLPSNKIVLDEKIENNIKLLLDMVIIKRRGDNLFLELKESYGVNWGPKDEASLLDEPFAKMLIKKAFPKEIGKQMFELIKVVK